MVLYYSGGSSYGGAWPECLLKQPGVMLTYWRERVEAQPPDRSDRLQAIETYQHARGLAARDGCEASCD